MTPYIINAALCCLSTYLGTRVKPKRLSKYFFIFAIFLPCFLAAVRDNTIGTDVMQYGERLFHLAKNTSFVSFLQNNSQEPLFLMITFWASNFANRYVYYFVLQLLVFLPIYLTLINQKDNKRAWLGILVYYVWLYSYSLNLMRQTIAISLLIYATKYIFDKNYKRYLIILVISMGFHVTAIIGLVPLLMYYVLVYEVNNQTDANNDKNKFKMAILNNSNVRAFDLFKRKYHVLFNGLCILCTIGIVYYGSSIIVAVYKLTGKFGYQVKHMSGAFDFNARYFLVMGLIIFTIYIMLKKQKISERPDSQLYLMVSLSGIILFQLMGFSFQMYRVSLYFTSYLVVFIPQTFASKKRSLSYYCSLVIIISLFFYLAYQTIVLNTWNEVYPYTSQFLGIYI